MTKYATSDPFTWPEMPPSVEACKATEKAKMAPPANAAKQKPHDWPGTPADGKTKKPPRHVPHAWLAPGVQYKRVVYGGYTLAEVVRVLLLLAAVLAAVLYFD